MNLANLFKKKERFVGLDLGSTTIKLVELSGSEGSYEISAIGSTPTEADTFAGYSVVKPERLADQIAGLIEANNIVERRIILGIPGPAVFTKRIKVPRMELSELAMHIELEAGNFIPHPIDAVKLDFHIIGPAGKNQLDVLVAAAKAEIIDNLVGCLAISGLEVAVADVDYFALQNMFEVCYPELKSKTIALINVGARYSSFNICRGGVSLFTGDMSLGGKFFTDALADGLGIDFQQAEKFKRDRSAKAVADVASSVDDAGQEILDRSTEHVAAEFNRQLSFFWNAAGSDESIDAIMLTGGGAQSPGLVEELREKTGVDCSILSPINGLAVAEGVDQAQLKALAPSLGICVGLAVREPGDKIIPEY